MVSMVKTRPLVGIMLFACCLFCCMTGGGQQKTPETVATPETAVDRPMACMQLPGGADTKSTGCICASCRGTRIPNCDGEAVGSCTALAADLHQTIIFHWEREENVSLRHLRRIDESETFQPMPTGEKADTTLKFLYGMPAGMDDNRKQLAIGREWKESLYYLVTSWLEGRAGGYFYCYVMDDFTF